MLQEDPANTRPAKSNDETKTKQICAMQVIRVILREVFRIDLSISFHIFPYLSYLLFIQSYTPLPRSPKNIAGIAAVPALELRRSACRCHEPKQAPAPAQLPSIWIECFYIWIYDNIYICVYGYVYIYIMHIYDDI